MMGLLVARQDVDEILSGDAGAPFETRQDILQMDERRFELRLVASHPQREHRRGQSGAVGKHSDPLAAQILGIVAIQIEHTCLVFAHERQRLLGRILDQQGQQAAVE